LGFVCGALLCQRFLVEGYDWLNVEGFDWTHVLIATQSLLMIMEFYYLFDYSDLRKAYKMGFRVGFKFGVRKGKGYVLGHMKFMNVVLDKYQLSLRVIYHLADIVVMSHNLIREGLKQVDAITPHSLMNMIKNWTPYRTYQVKCLMAQDVLELSYPTVLEHLQEKMKAYHGIDRYLTLIYNSVAHRTFSFKCLYDWNRLVSAVMRNYICHVNKQFDRHVQNCKLMRLTLRYCNLKSGNIMQDLKKWAIVRKFGRIARMVLHNSVISNVWTERAKVMSVVPYVPKQKVSVWSSVICSLLTCITFNVWWECMKSNNDPLLGHVINIINHNISFVETAAKFL
jgi:hypothetical protein